MTHTPNPTAEQIRELVANLIPLDLIHDRHRPEQPQNAFEAADRIIAALRAHNLLSEGAPTEAQVEAAAKALRADKGFMAEVHSALEVSWSEYIARLVLVAAQGAAPQAECSERPGGRPCEASKPGHKMHWSNGPGIEQGAAPQAEGADCDRDRMGICKRCGMGWDARKVLDGDFACPVLPSSGVDEEKLAEVIGKARTVSVRGEDGVKSVVMATNEQIARAVAEWLEGQGGESRGE